MRRLGRDIPFFFFFLFLLSHPPFIFPSYIFFHCLSLVIAPLSLCSLLVLLSLFLFLFLILSSSSFSSSLSSQPPLNLFYISSWFLRFSSSHSVHSVLVFRFLLSFFFFFLSLLLSFFLDVSSSSRLSSSPSLTTVFVFFLLYSSSASIFLFSSSGSLPFCSPSHCCHYLSRHLSFCISSFALHSDSASAAVWRVAQDRSIYSSSMLTAIVIISPPFAKFSSAPPS